ncbi:MAG: hypothetical protein K6A44_04630 [bacterium]|nr:hypothetical protein [bacterium]
MNNAERKIYTEMNLVPSDSLSELTKKSSEIKANMSITLLKRSLSKYLNE